MSLQIAIVLVCPENPDNIGAVARAMKNMGLRDLRLVKPPSGWKSKGRKMAMAARDVLESARGFASLEQAVEDARLVIGTTRRRGPRRGLFMAYPKAILKMKQVSRRQRVAVLFGKESKGLDNASLNLCDGAVSIPADEAYPSLNLAQAVMVIAFSLFRENKVKKGDRSLDLSPFFCTKSEIEDALQRFEKGLLALDYDKGKGLVERILATMRGIFKKNGMLKAEAQMIKGLSRTIVEKLKRSR